MTRNTILSLALMGTLAIPALAQDQSVSRLAATSDAKHLAR